MCYSAATPPKSSGPTCAVNTKPALDHQPSLQRMTIMTTDSSATVPEETPHETETTQITISDALRRRAQSVINNSSIDLEWRTIIRFALELNDEWLSKLVPRAEAGENMLDALDSLRILKTNEDNSNGDKIEALAEIICGAGGPAAAALFVLMGTLQNSAEPEALANAAKQDRKSV